MQTAPRVRKRLAAVVGASALLLPIQGCGGSAQPEVKLGAAATDAPSASSTPISSGAATALRKPSLPAPRNDLSGRMAFARYVVGSIAYSLGSNDPAPITSVALTHGTLRCDTCTGFATYLRQQAAKQEVRRPWQLPVTHVQDQGQVQPGLSVVDVVVRRPALADVDSSGTAHRPQAAAPHYLYEIGMQWDQGTWKLTGWLEKKT